MDGSLSCKRRFCIIYCPGANSWLLEIALAYSFCSPLHCADQEIITVVSAMEAERPHPERLPTQHEIDENTSSIQDLDRRIAALTIQIEALDSIRCRLERERNVKASFIAPFRRLPPEILGEIAVQYQQLGGSLIVLTSVSSNIRRAVVCMKTLWSNLHIIDSREGFEPYFDLAPSVRRSWNIFLSFSDLYRDLFPIIILNV